MKGINNQIFIIIVSISLLTLSCSKEDNQLPDSSDLDIILVRGTEYWDWRQSPVQDDFLSISSSIDGYVIGGSRGLTMYSADGKTWYTGTWNGNHDYLASTVLNGLYISIGNGPHCNINGPTIGGNPNTNQENTLNAITSSNDLSVAVGNNGELITTQDGLQWTRFEQIADDDLFAITWTGSSFFCGGKNGIIYKSQNGTSWFVEDTIIQSKITDISSTNFGLYVVTETGNIWKKNLETWTKVYEGTGIPLSGITEYDETIVAIGDNSSIIISKDGDNWQLKNLDLNSDFRGISAAKGFAIVGSNNYLIYSQDGLLWEERPSFPPNYLYKIASNGINLVAACRHGIIHSSNSVDWTFSRYAEYEGVYSICWTNDGYVACGKDGLVLTSKDGEQWSKASIQDDLDLWSVVNSENITYIGSDSGKIWSSSDNQQWECINTSASGAIFGIAQSPSIIVAVTTKGEAIIISNGKEWTVVTTEAERFSDVIWNGTKFLAVQYNGLYQSADGINWSYIAIPDAKSLRSIAYDGQLTYVVGVLGQIFSSVDLQSWKNEVSGFEDKSFNLNHHTTFSHVFANKDEVYIVGSSGIILQRK